MSQLNVPQTIVKFDKPPKLALEHELAIGKSRQFMWVYERAGGAGKRFVIYPNSMANTEIIQLKNHLNTSDEPLPYPFDSFIHSSWKL